MEKENDIEELVDRMVKSLSKLVDLVFPDENERKRRCIKQLEILVDESNKAKNGESTADLFKLLSEIDIPSNAEIFLSHLNKEKEDVE